MAQLDGQYGKSVAARCRAARSERGWSAATLGQLAGLSPQHILAIERDGRPNVAASTVAKLAMALAVSSDWLLGLTDEPDGHKNRPRRGG